ncbi:Os01g0574550 [Oryza sativa Japonica Group]|uniref:Os01g0574550 protein n=1 Tax=Oryza sativa subsp. japonica TaxID=39947 RepID=A0A0P0V4C0_ORYSJ|nr:hypothetical protein EE612_003623 [Oryza sativa]BAS72814.1 Os01g0574550 [Oryza sativa Japonica Group]
MATRACPPSWYAVNFRDSSEITADLRSLPIMIRSLAYSRSFIVTAFAPSMAALRAATLTKLARSAPENPGVPLAMIIKSTSSLFTFDIWDSRICRRPSTSGFGTTICRSKRPGLTSALSRDSGKLVAAITIIPSFCLKPSSSTSNWFNVIFIYC